MALEFTYSRQEDYDGITEQIKLLSGLKINALSPKEVKKAKERDNDLEALRKAKKSHEELIAAEKEAHVKKQHEARTLKARLDDYPKMIKANKLAIELITIVNSMERVDGYFSSDFTLSNKPSVMNSLSLITTNTQRGIRYLSQFQEEVAS